jgi:cobalamin biosynthesis protein CobD/CbiB
VGITAGPFAVGWIITTLLHRLPDPYWLISFAAVFFMLPIQSVANEINRVVATGHDENRRIRGWNWLAVALGGSLLVLTAIGTIWPA